jgi:cysteine desulfurase
MKIRAYLDNNATTRLAPQALAAMTPFLTELFLNPASAAGELFGASRPILDAKLELARLLGAADLADRLTLTSGASEANSWVVHATTIARPGAHIVSSAIEHPSLLAALEAAHERGAIVELARPDTAGRIHPDAIGDRLTPETALVSVMLANNETGVIQPIADIGRLVRSMCPAALFHVDATQALGRIADRVADELADVDLISLSAHKLHGPKGIGALFAAEGVNLAPLIHGSHEKGLRGGTQDAAAAAGLAAAARLAFERLPDMIDVERLRDHFERDLIGRFPNVQILGMAAQRLPNTSAFIIPGIDGEATVEHLALEGIVIATGSACTSGASVPSHVLLAMGIPYDAARSALRISLSHETSEAELNLALNALSESAQCGGFVTMPCLGAVHAAK